MLNVAMLIVVMLIVAAPIQQLFCSFGLMEMLVGGNRGSSNSVPRSKFKARISSKLFGQCYKKFTSVKVHLHRRFRLAISLGDAILK
jgi:hypothetical protein